MITTNIFTPHAGMFNELCRVLPAYIFGNTSENTTDKRNLQIRIITINEFVIVSIQSIREFDNIYYELFRLRWSIENNTYVLFDPNQYDNIELAKLAVHLHRQLVNIDDISIILNANPYVVSNWIAIYGNENSV
jgi:hypothetical protein